MRLSPEFKKEKGFQYQSYIIKTFSEIPESIEILFFDDAYQNNFISQPEYFTKRINDLQITPINFLIEGENCWKIMEGGKVLRIIIFGRKSYNKALILLKRLMIQYSIGIDNIILGFEDKNFIKEIKKTTS